MKLLLKLLILFLCGASIAVPAQASAAGVTISVAHEEDADTIKLELPDAAKTKAFLLPAPPRLVVDLPASIVKNKPQLAEIPSESVVSNIRTGRFNAQIYRLVFELKQSVTFTQNMREDDSTALLLTLKPQGPPPKKADSAKPKKTDEKPLIVIDAGHGGDDPGTIGRNKTYEKHVTLAYAKALRDALVKSGKYRVKLTREDDRFLRLRKRFEVAREAKADLFLSIHADSAPGGMARGLSVYTLSETASDKEAEALAERENKSDVIAGMDLAGQSEDVAEILISLAQRDTKNRSALLAEALVKHLKRDVVLLPNAHRYAGFAVLKAPDIPSVLIELGFLSNPKEEKLLQTKPRREAIVQGIMRGIDHYLTARGAAE